MDYSTYVLFVAIAGVGYINWQQTSHQGLKDTAVAQLSATCLLVILWICWQVAFFN